MGLGRYHEETLLGTGGMAEVWKAKGPQGTVALKRLLPHAARNRSLCAAFEREGRLLSQLAHPNVIGIHEVLRDEKGTCLVLEYVEGADLRVLSHGAAPVRVALRIIRDLLLALQAVHELRDEDGRPLGLIHRDLSPANVLVGIDGRVKLTDFGIARSLFGSQATTGISIKGTLAYLSPEQASGAPVDARADLFAAGALLYELIGGATIYDESDPRLALAKARAGDVPSLAAVRPETPAALVELVDRALSATPSDRYTSARAMAAELERTAEQTCGIALDEELASWVRSSLAALGSDTPTLTGSSSNSARKSRTTRWVPALVAFGLVGAVGSWWAVRWPSHAKTIAVVTSVAPSLPAAPLPLQGSVELPSAVPMVTNADPGASAGPPSAPKRLVSIDKSVEKGLLDIGSEPGFAYVTIDGVKVGATPIFGRALTAGTHRIEVSREGLGSKSFSLDVRPGARISRVVKLP